MPLRSAIRPLTTLCKSHKTVHPRAFQLQCRRLKSNQVPPNLEPMPRNAPEPPAPSPPEQAAMPPMNLQMLQYQIQNAQREAQRRKFETPSTHGQLKSGEEDKSFHPVFVGFLAGVMLASGVAFTLYHFSGSYHVQKASQRAYKAVSEDQERIATALAPSASVETDLTAQEVGNWLQRASAYYGHFQPNSEAFVAARVGEIEKGLAEGKDKSKEVERIARECAVELQKEVGAGNFYQNVMSGLMSGRIGWNIIMKHLVRIEEVVEGKEFAEKRRLRAAKGLVDEQGRDRG